MIPILGSEYAVICPVTRATLVFKIIVSIEIMNTMYERMDVHLNSTSDLSPLYISTNLDSSFSAMF